MKIKVGLINLLRGGERKRPGTNLAESLLFVEFADSREVGIDAADRIVSIYDEETILVSLA